MTQVKSQERPLVTFALFAYNQEKYIWEAIEGAFSQTYEPLEIILSDDCSSDETFDIMEKMAAAYHGPHEVRVRRNDVNSGTVDHVISVAREARGELLVVAAGDDISMPFRCEKLLEAWIASKAMALYSNATTIDNSGLILDRNFCHKPALRTQHLFSGITCARRYDGLVRNIPGYSAAYNTKMLSELPKNEVRALNEDALTTIVVNVLGGHIEKVSLPLLYYRVYEESTLGNNSKRRMNAIIKNEKKSVSFARSSAAFYPYVNKLLKEGKWPASFEDIVMLVSRLEQRFQMAKAHTDLWDHGFWVRLQLAITGKSAEIKKFAVARLLGIKFFSLMKLIRSSHRLR